MSDAAVAATGSQPASLMRTGLDSRALLAYVAVAVVLALGVQHPLQVLAVCSAVWLVVVGVLDPGEYRPFLAYGVVSALGVVLLNPLVSRAGVTLLWTGPVLPLVGRMTVSAEAIVFGVVSALRLLAVVGAFALFSALMNPDALYRLIAPHSLGSALVVALSIRLFPAGVRDAERIGDAMRARGVKLDSGNVAERVRARAPVVEALAMTSLDRAMDLAEALESRGHGRAGRSRLPHRALAGRDRGVIAVAGLAAVTGACFAIVSAGYRYYPVLGDPARPFDLLGACVLAVLVALPLALEWGWSAWLSSKPSG